MAGLEQPTTGYLLWLVTNKWRAAVDRAVAPLGLTHAQYTVLASLFGLARTGRKPSQRQLADVAGLEPIYVSKLVRALERAGMLTRTEHPADPRAVQLALTPGGEQTAARAVGTVRDLLEELTAPIGGTRGRRNRELVATLRTLLDPRATDAHGHDADHAPAGGPGPAGLRGTTDDDDRAPTERGTMSQAPTPTLTGQDIGEAEGATRALLDEILAPTGVTSDEYIVLRVLTFRGPYESPAALHDFLAGQRQLHLDRPAVAALLRGLEERGLVEGTAADAPGPARLTAEGAALHRRLAERVAATTARLYAGFDADDLAVAQRVLRGVIHRADELRRELAGGRSPDTALS